MSIAAVSVDPPGRYPDDYEETHVDRDRGRVRRVAIWFVIIGVLTIIAGTFLLGWVHLGIKLAFAPDEMKNLPHDYVMHEHVLGWVVVALSTVAVLLVWGVGTGMIAAGFCMRSRQRYTFCYVMAYLSCLVIPAGSILGWYTIVLLRRRSAREIFRS
ncbi:MAG: hypothetical protein QF785_05820 [Phycisphaeraceae bacterium]|jgi:hypothetical protein|nr:hypothetical protein [Phycisphaeraceae bacterium]MDP7348993.1 hypothetical protein [Phycisphaeraceae bacterium]